MFESGLEFSVAERVPKIIWLQYQDLLYQVVWWYKLVVNYTHFQKMVVVTQSSWYLHGLKKLDSEHCKWDLQ